MNAPNLESTYRPALSRRSTAKLELLGRIAAEPGRCKMAVITANGAERLPNKTRSGHYVMIDKLIWAGLVEDRGRANLGGYELHPTPAGYAELGYWAVQS